MDARAGAVTDAYVKGAQPTDVMDLETHTQFATNRRYSRNRWVATSRIPVLRFGGKNRTPGRGRHDGRHNLDARDRAIWLGH